MIGKTISHYKILEKLGEGGMGVVYKAQDTKLDRVVALKFLPAHLVADEEAKTRFTHEAKAASALDHPNIATIHEIDEAEGQSFISMAFVDGKSLKNIIREREFSTEQVLDVAVQIGEGLSAAHKKGIVHRDIKSDNIMLTGDGMVKVMDFGLAKLEGVPKVTKPGSTVGTVAYMSPEQCQGAEVDERSDIFSFGVVLYEIITGQLPFKGEHEAAVTYSICNQDPEPISRYKAGVPEGLQAIVEKALQKDPGVRYQSVADLVADVRRLQREKVIPRTTAPEKTAVTGRNITLVALAALVVLVAYLALDRFYLTSHTRAGSSDAGKSIAVLPFKNLSEDKSNEYFSDGITEDIIAQLSKIGDLRVISRTSVMLYKESDKSLRQIGDELGVATILEGSVRRADGRVRIVSQLIDARTDAHIWAETYDRDLKDIFAIQSDVAQKIAGALKAQLSSEERGRLERVPTGNLTAYDYYLKGREFYSRYRKEDNEQAMQLFKKAVELDSSYALAYAGLADAYGQAVGKFGSTPDWSDSAETTALKAISIDPNCAEAYKALGLVYLGTGRLSKALEANRRAVALKPNCEPAVSNIGWINLTKGRLDEAFRWARKAVGMNPTSAYTNVGLGVTHFAIGNFSEAETWLNKALELDPELIWAYRSLVRFYREQGDYDGAAEYARRAIAIAPGTPGVFNWAGDVELHRGNYAKAREYYKKGREIFGTELQGRRALSRAAELAYVYLRTGEQNKAQQTFEIYLDRSRERLAKGEEDWRIPYALMRFYAIRGEKAEAYLWLQKAVDAGWTDYRAASMDPLLESLRDDEEFRELMAELKARVDEMRRRVEEE